MAAKGLDTTDLATYSRALAPQRCFPAQRAAITMADNILSSSPPQYCALFTEKPRRTLVVKFYRVYIGVILG